MFGLDLGGWVIVAAILALAFVLSTIAASLYQKCSPNQAMIISGMSKIPTVAVGGGAFIVPFLQMRNDLSLEVMTIEVASQAPFITKNGVPIFVEGVAQVKVEGNDEAIRTAAEQFLGKSDDEIKSIAHESLVGHLRAILGTMTVEELIQSFDSFAQRVQ